MSIKYQKETGIFTLHTKHTTYQMQVDNLGTLLHLYYGEKIADEDVSFLIIRNDRGFSPNPGDRMEERDYSLDFLPQEYAGIGTGDFRIPAISPVNGDGSLAFSGRYKRHKIYDGPYELSGLPKLRDQKKESQTLEITLEDEATGLMVELLYGVFEEADVITRAVKVLNQGKEEIKLSKVMSCTLDFLESDYDLIHFGGHHVQEHEYHRQPVSFGCQSFGSVRGYSSHQHNPSGILCKTNASEEEGDCYGFVFVYSGNFLCEVEKNQFSQMRMNLGIHPQQFEWRLLPGESFTAPQVVLSYSETGLSRLTNNFHNIFRTNLCESKYMNQVRPVLLNSWEAVYLDFDEKKILEIARSSKELGTELFVMDDGWFVNRNDDSHGLGDWELDEKKLPHGLCWLSEQIHQMGLLFGIWIEPEMVSQGTKLYKEHPDWVIQIPGRNPSMGRDQMVLDLSRKEVRDYLVEKMNGVIREAHADYVKWDANRSITDIYSQALPGMKQGEVFHRYMLGLYDLMDRIILANPDVLFEGCSGGGGRFDAGMLYYQPQIWGSDDTDAIARLKIQYGLSYLYPSQTIGSHVSVCPNHQTGRMTPLHTRAVTAMHGTFGFELDPSDLSEEEKKQCKEYAREYKEYAPVMVEGDYYRLTNPYENHLFTGWMHVTKDKQKAWVSLVMTDVEGNAPISYLKLRGLDKDGMYRVDGLNLVCSGTVLMKMGIPITWELKEYEAVRYCLTRIDKE